MRNNEARMDCVVGPNVQGSQYREIQCELCGRASCSAGIYGATLYLPTFPAHLGKSDSDNGLGSNNIGLTRKTDSSSRALRAY